MLSVPANAGVTFNDDYWGYTNPTLSARDVVGNMFFDIDQGHALKFNNDLIVQVLTKYTESIDPTPDNPQTPDINRVEGELDTFIGDLFLGTGGLNLNIDASVGAPHPTHQDRYSFQLDRWNYAVTSPDDQSVGTGESPQLRSITEADVIRSFYDDLGDPLDDTFRHDQQVLADGGDVLGNEAKFEIITVADNAINEWMGKDGSGASTYKAGYGVLQWTIADFFELSDFTGPNASDRLAIGWAMTCANDVIINEVRLDSLITSEVPIPAGLPLFLTGLLGLGFLGRYRSKKRAENA